jgi:hypothetical protein
VSRRLLTIALGGLVVLLSVLAGGIPAHAAAAPGTVPDCPPLTVKDSTKHAMAVFSGTVTAVERQERTDGQLGAIYLQTVTVDLVYQGKLGTESVQVQTDRSRAECSLGELATGSEYMFFVTGTGTPWVASGVSGTRLSSETVVAQVERLLGEGQPPVEPAPEKAVFTPVDTSEPQTLSRTAAPGAALVLIGLLGLLLVRGLTRRSR